MSNRPAEGQKQGRSQPSQSQFSSSFEASRGAGGRGNSHLASGVGSGPPGHSGPGSENNPVIRRGMDYGGFNPSQGEGGNMHRAASASTPSRGVTLPQGVPPYPPQQGGIMFGNFVAQEDGSVEKSHSPQQSERHTPEPNKVGGRSGPVGGRGTPRQAPRNVPKPTGGRNPGMQGPQGMAGSPMAFGNGVPLQYAYTHMPYPYAPYNIQSVNQAAFQTNYQGFQQNMYSLGGYPGQQFQQSQQQYQGHQQFARGPPQTSYQGNNQSARQNQPYPEGKMKHPAPERKSRALPITDPHTKQPIVVERPTTAPLPGAQASRKPPQGAPTPRAGQPSQAGPVPPQSRQLNISAPPEGGPSKASPSQAKAGKTSAAVVTTPTPVALEEGHTANEKQLSTSEGSANGDKASTPAPPTTSASQPISYKSAAVSQQPDSHKQEEKEAAVDTEADGKKADELSKKSAEEAAKKAAAEEEKRKIDQAKAAQEAAAKEAAQEDEAKRRAEEAALKEKVAKEAEAKKAAEEAAAKKAAEEAAAKKAAEEAEAKQRADEEAERAAQKRAEAEKAKKIEEEKAAAERDAAEKRLKGNAEKEAASPLHETHEDEGTQGAAAQPKKKGKKALNAAIAARKEAETESYDGREVDMSAYKPAVQKQPEKAEVVPQLQVSAQQSDAEEQPALASKASVEDDADWEEKTIETPRAALSAQPSATASSGRKMYSQDFLSSREKILRSNGSYERWPGLEKLDKACMSLLRGARGGYDRDSGRGALHPGGRSDDKWGHKSRHPGSGFQPPGISGPPPPPGRGMGGRGPARGSGNVVSGGIESDRWGSGKALPPVPQQSRMPQLHRTANRYERGRLISENPEEEKKQKEIKSLLNKITPEKYDIIRDKLIAVNIESPLSLRGLIDQVFDKALIETTFSELYAKLCVDLNKSLPEFAPEANSEDAKMINFRRSLLNKCQEEFEEGAAAITAVKAREQADAEKGQADGKEEKEEGELSTEDKENTRSQELKDVEAEQKARRRALGNIQFVGQLYKERMLTEKIMHGCIRTLLEDVEKPRREDIECLCKLMSTIGGQLDNSARNPEVMSIYFQRMDMMAHTEGLEVRLKFMIQDVLDLRQNNWQARRKVEGPKTIEQIHRDARMEQMAQARPPPDRYGSSIGGRGGARGGYGYREQAPPMRGLVMPPRRHEDRLEEKPRPMARTPSQEGIFAPGGKSSFRPGGALASRGPSPSTSRESTPAAPAAAPKQEQRAQPAAETRSASPSAPKLSDEEVEAESIGLLMDYMQSRSVAEVDCIFKEKLVPGQVDLALLVDKWFKAACEKKEIDREALKELITVTAKEKLIPAEAFQKGMASVLNQLHDTAVDAPFAPKLVGEVLAFLLSAKMLELPAAAEMINKAGIDDPEYVDGDDPPLIDSGHAGSVIGTTLQHLVQLSSKEEALSAWRSSKLQLQSFLPSYEQDNSKVLEGLIQKYQLQDFSL